MLAPMRLLIRQTLAYAERCFTALETVGAPGRDNYMSFLFEYRRLTLAARLYGCSGEKSHFAASDQEVCSRWHLLRPTASIWLLGSISRCVFSFSVLSVYSDALQLDETLFRFVHCGIVQCVLLVWPKFLAVMMVWPCNVSKRQSLRVSSTPSYYEVQTDD